MKLFDTSHTRVEFWKYPQFTRTGMLWVTICIGFFGLHHLYLRSPHTWIASFFVNLFTFGWWWTYDILQLYTRSDSDLNEFGLDTPWGALGLGKGMFTTKETLEAQSENPPADAPPNPLFTLVYYLILPVSSVLAAAVAGDTPNAVSKLFTVLPFYLLYFFIPVFNVLWLSNIPSWLYDLYRAFITPKTLFEKGHSRFAPFTWIGFDVENHSPNIQVGGFKEECPPKSTIEAISDLVKNLLKLFIPIVMIISPETALALEKVLATGQAVVTVAKEGVKKGEQLMEVGKSAVQIASSAPAAIEGLSQKVNPLALVKDAAISAGVPTPGGNPLALVKDAAISAGVPTPTGNPLALVKDAAISSGAPPFSLKGGGSSSEPPVTPADWTSMGVMGTILVILVGAFTVQSIRSLSDEPPQRIQRVVETFRGDTPPHP